MTKEELKNMETIKLNDIEYIKKEEYDKIKDNPIDNLKYAIKEPYNVMAIVPFIYDESLNKDELNINGIGDYKIYKGELNLSKLDKNFKPEIFVLDKTRYSYEFLKKAIKINKSFGYNSSPEFYLRFDGLKYINDYPCLIKLGGMLFILAPRVEE